MVCNIIAPVASKADSETGEASLMEEYEEIMPLYSEDEILEGANLLEDNKVKDVPLMKAYQEDIITLAEDRR